MSQFAEGLSVRSRQQKSQHSRLGPCQILQGLQISGDEGSALTPLVWQTRGQSVQGHRVKSPQPG